MVALDCIMIMNRAGAQHRSGQLEEAIESWSEAVERFQDSDQINIQSMVAKALIDSDTGLIRLRRFEKALTVLQQIEDRFGTSDAKEMAAIVANSLLKRCAALFELSRLEEGLAVSERAMHRFGNIDSPEVTESVAVILLNKGIALAVAGRNEDALSVWLEIESRFGDHSEPGILKRLASALVRKGTTLLDMGRSESAIRVWDDVMHRFKGDAVLYHAQITSAALERMNALAQLGRLEEALLASEEVLHLVRGGSEASSMHSLARVLLTRGSLLISQHEITEGLAAWDEVVDRFEKSGTAELRGMAELALCERGNHELTNGRIDPAIAFLDRALLPTQAGTPRNRLRGHLIRAKAYIAEGNDESCVSDIERALSFLPESATFPRRVIEMLAELAVDIGMARMRDLINSSPAADILLPLTTAFERELGLEPKVAREVDEVAEDIRREFLSEHARSEAWAAH